MDLNARRVLAIEREGRLEAARAELAARLVRGRTEDAWFRAPAVVGCVRGRDVELRWPGGPHAAAVDLVLRIRMGERFSARARHRLWRYFGFSYLALRGVVPDGVPFVAERLLRDFEATRVWCAQGRVGARLRWDPDAPDPARLLAALERLHRIALALEGVHEPRAETGGTLTCPFCRAPISEEDPLARCDACFTPHHPSCFEEGGGCSLYGCGNRSARSRTGRFLRGDGKDEA
ncbi:MAG: RING finger protein [Planctomycetota bacterium]